jgi:outer membrane receptor protein involved in Fe transport
LSQYVYWPGGSTSDGSAYSELTVPLLRKANKIPLVKLLDLQVAGRYDDIKINMTAPVQNITTTRVNGTKTYSPALLNGSPQPLTLGTTTYKSTNSTIGFKYKPIEGIFFRMSYSSAFVPPTYAQLVTPISTGTITQSTGAYPGVPTTSPWNYQSITDTRLSNAVYTVPVMTGGNPNLRPETSKGINWGVVIEPTFAKGLRISLDYVKVTKHDAIITPTAATLIPYADSFPGRVTRGTPNAGQTVGPIVLIDNTAINAPELMTSSYNLKVDYTFGTSLGRWDLSAVATSWQHYKQQATIGGPLVEGINNPNFTTTGNGLMLAKLKGNMTLDWTKGPFSAGWMTRYVGPYLLGSRYAPGGAFPIQGTPDGRVSSDIYHDAYFGYRLSKAAQGSAWWRRALADTSMQVGVRNVFDKVPPYAALGGVQFQYYSAYGDARLRSYYCTLKKSF